jgi:hypothetical protein
MKNNLKSLILPTKFANCELTFYHPGIVFVNSLCGWFTVSFVKNNQFSILKYDGYGNGTIVEGDDLEKSNAVIFYTKRENALEIYQDVYKSLNSFYQLNKDLVDNLLFQASLDYYESTLKALNKEMEALTRNKESVAKRALEAQDSLIKLKLEKENYFNSGASKMNSSV